MKDCERYPHMEPDYPARAEEHERREERRLRTLNNAWNIRHEPSAEENLPAVPKPPAAERIEPAPSFSQSA
jgi:hypothetical protein